MIIKQNTIFNQARMNLKKTKLKFKENLRTACLSLKLISSSKKNVMQHGKNATKRLKHV